MKKALRQIPGWEEISVEEKYRDPYTRLVLETVRPPARDEGIEWTVVHRKTAAVVAPVTRENRFVLIRQDRIPVRMDFWEFPAGQIDEVGECYEVAVRETALREMREECGYRLAGGGELTSLGHFFTSPGFTDEHAYLFIARHVEPDDCGHDHDAHESIHEVRAFTPGELTEMVASGRLKDANSLSTYARLVARGYLDGHA